MTPIWQRELQSAFRELGDLLAYLRLDQAQAPQDLWKNPHFPLRVPVSFAQRMKPQDWMDPLLRQVLPTESEKNPAEGFTSDAVGDLQAQVIPGLLHKYANRALFMASPHCAVHCRYCFRREFPYGELPKAQVDWDRAWDYLAASPGIQEIIFSGGDPLFLDNRRVAALIRRALAIPHVHTLRFHTRIPIVLPSRLESELIAILSECAENTSVVMVIHANHPRELHEDCLAPLRALRKAGLLILNQAVLLRHVNDDEDTLVALSQALIQAGIMPYYLHQLDRVSGTSHFEVAEQRGLALMQAIRKRLPGYAMPTYVREIAGEAHKTPLF